MKRRIHIIVDSHRSYICSQSIRERLYWPCYRLPQAPTCRTERTKAEQETEEVPCEAMVGLSTRVYELTDL